MARSTSEIADQTSEVRPESVLHTLDAELAAVIDRLRRARADIRLLLRDAAPDRVPPV